MNLLQYTFELIFICTFYIVSEENVGLFVRQNRPVGDKVLASAGEKSRIGWSVIAVPQVWFV